MFICRVTEVVAFCHIYKDFSESIAEMRDRPWRLWKQKGEKEYAAWNVSFD